MELPGDQILERYAEQCSLCTQITLLLSEYEWSCSACGSDDMKQKK